MKTAIVVFFVAIAVLFGACSFSGNGYSGEVGGAFRDAAQIGLQREQVKQAAETDRQRIQAQADAADAASRERTAPYWLGAAVVVAACWFGVNWTRRPHRPVPAAPAHIAMWAQPYLAADERRYIDCVDGEWVVVDDVRRELLPVARRLVG